MWPEWVWPVGGNKQRERGQSEVRGMYKGKAKVEREKERRKGNV